jgi:hypothetical protein
MKKILFILVAFIMAATVSSCGSYVNAVHINLSDIHSNAMHKQFMKANKLNQLEIMQRLSRQASDAYYASETLDQLYALRQDVNTLLTKYAFRMNKESMGEIENALNLLNSKIDRSIRSAEGDTTGSRGINSYHVFGQEL